MQWYLTLHKSFRPQPRVSDNQPSGSHSRYGVAPIDDTRFKNLQTRHHSLHESLLTIGSYNMDYTFRVKIVKDQGQQTLEYLSLEVHPGIVSIDYSWTRFIKTLG
jgi:hypothetical protein